MRALWNLFRAALFLFCTTLLLPATPILADGGPGGSASLSAAQARFADLDFEGALTAFQAVSGSGDSDPRTRASALTGQGLCQQVLGRPKEARASFLEALSIDPKQSLPADTSPKLRRPFAAARQAYLKGYAPKLTLDRAALPSGSVVIRTQDALGLVASVEVLVSFSGRMTTLKARDRSDGSFEARPKSSGRASLRVRALNQYGIEVAQLGVPKALVIRLPAAKTEPEVAVATTVTTTPDPPDPKETEDPKDLADRPDPEDDPAQVLAAAAAGVAGADPVTETSTGLGPDLSDPGTAPASSGGGGLRPLAYGFAGGAAAALGGAIALGLSAKANERAFNGDPTAFVSQTEALETGRSARSQALGSSLLYGGAALLAGGAALFYLWNPADQGPSGFVLAPTPDGAVVVLTLSLP